MKTILGGGMMLLLAAHVTAELPSWETLVDRARWAANAHNVQSWRLADVAGRPDQKVLGFEPTRLLPETDPPSRQLFISLGTLVAVLEDEAAVRGARVTSQLIPNDRVLITLSAAGGPEVRPDLDALTAPTVKYATQPLVLDATFRRSTEALSTPRVRVSWVADPDTAAATKRWAQGAYDLEMTLARTRDESLMYTRYGEAARNARPWGITLLPNFPRDQAFWAEAWTSVFPPSPQDYGQSARDLMRRALGPVAQFLVVTSQGNGRPEQFETGLVVQRLWLAARSQGGELLPLSQGLEEFPEMATFYQEAHRRWARGGETVQMVLAVFRPAPGVFGPSPRLPATALFSHETVRVAGVEDLADGVGGETVPIGQGVDR